ncbi:hypothetical protein QUF63_13140 [Anaerolineales bacterium HSG25]|nr:hypothetical protein [Anaerolineales bacterium HSG25]
MYPYLKLSYLQDHDILINNIYNNYNHDYYLTDDWSPEMYNALAYVGFISVSVKDQTGAHYLMPEMQFSYVVLHWKNLHISKQLRKFIAKNLFHDQYYISLNQELAPIFEGVSRYHGARNWLTERYLNLLNALIPDPDMPTSMATHIKPVAVGLWHHDQLIGGEIGYLTGGIYTSLTGFFDRENYSNFGKIQLIGLALLLKKFGYTCWNLGHPYMVYKFEMGGLEYERENFLRLWLTYRNDKITANILGQRIECQALFQEIIKPNRPVRQ